MKNTLSGSVVSNVMRMNGNEQMLSINIRLRMKPRQTIIYIIYIINIESEEKIKYGVN